MPQNILIVGATGLIGVYITRAIVAAKDKFGRVAILTSLATLEKKADLVEKLKGQGVEILQGDIAKEEDVKKAYHGPPASSMRGYVLLISLTRTPQGLTPSYHVSAVQPFSCKYHSCNGPPRHRR